MLYYSCENHHGHCDPRETGFYYLQSRYYDPSIGRFINADSFASTGQGFLGHNMFTYCHNNPILYADPSGRFIVISGDATDEQIVEYNRAVAYIKKSPTGSALIDFLEASTETFTIVFVDNDMTQYNYDTNQIDWDVNSGLIMGNNTSVQSAALGLAHEMGHAAQDINGIYEQHKTNGNFLEQDNLDTYESKIASELGEPSRSGRGAYYGAKGFMDMNNSTHFRTTQHSPWYHYVLPFIFGWPQKTIVDHNMLD